MYQDKKRLFDDIDWIVKLLYCLYLEKSRFISRTFFENFKLLKETSGYYFHFLLISSDQYCNDSFSQDKFDIFYFFPHTLTHYNISFARDRRHSKFIFHFKCNYILRNSELLNSCQSCIDEYFRVFSHSNSFKRLFHNCFIIHA